jgi:hypothetical protein
LIDYDINKNKKFFKFTTIGLLSDVYNILNNTQQTNGSTSGDKKIEAASKREASAPNSIKLTNKPENTNKETAKKSGGCC